MNRKYYIQKANDQATLEAICLKKSDKLSIIRLATFILLFTFTLLGFSKGLSYGLIVLMSSVILFTYLVYLSKKNKTNLRDIQRLMLFYNNEVIVSDGLGNLFGDGSEMKDINHNFSNDLDIFGKHSLFNKTNRTVTSQGKQILGNWLNIPEMCPKTIIKRQSIIKELSPKVAFREQFQSTYFKYKISPAEDINNWVSSYSIYFKSRPEIRMMTIVLSTLTVFLFVCAIIFNQWTLMTIPLILILGINFFINYYFRRKVNNLHIHVSGKGDLFAMHVDLIQQVEKQNFENEYINHLVSGTHGFVKMGHQLNVLKNLVNHLDIRLNILLTIPLNILFFWDIHYCLKIENWLQINNSLMRSHLQNLGEFDALASLSSLTFNNPDWVFPTPLTTGSSISALSIGHPLIPMEGRIHNDYTLDDTGRLDIITGSNMAGKSTFLKTIGINLVLAQIGCPVCSNTFRFTPFYLYTSMKISDSIADNLSTFFAELQRVKNMLNAIKERKPCFFLLDELFRGTNSKDRHAGSTALIKQIIAQNATGLLATHDLSLTELYAEYPDEINNYYFDIEIKDNDLHFDYTLKKGISSTSNAAFLLHKIGLDLE